MICFIIGTPEEPGYIFGDRAPIMADGRKVIGIQTPIEGPKRGPIIQGGISSPFHDLTPHERHLVAEHKRLKAEQPSKPTDQVPEPAHVKQARSALSNPPRETRDQSTP